MQRTSRATTVTANEPSATAAVSEIKPVTESAAAERMWIYYRDNKAKLISDIKEYRESIVLQLMAGHAVEQVFAPFIKPLQAAKPERRAA
jgi:hypothetical protein